MSKAELHELRAELRAIREENARLERRLERVEVGSSVTGRVSGTPTAAKGASHTLPPLTVVKLKPKVEPAPKLETGTAVVEPGPEQIEALASPPATEPSEEIELDPAVGEAMFENGLSALKTGNVAGGVDSLLRFVEQFPKHAKADNALYFSGVGLMSLEALEDAATTFGRVLSAYPASDAVVDAMLKLAECNVKLNRPAEARAVYEKIVSTFPGSAAATQASARLASIGATGAGSR
ncbi:MAG: tetratricopeptide repeat protein [Myxococcota bacterium]